MREILKTIIDLEKSKLAAIRHSLNRMNKAAKKRNKGLRIIPKQKASSDWLKLRRLQLSSELELKSLKHDLDNLD